MEGKAEEETHNNGVTNQPHTHTHIAHITIGVTLQVKCDQDREEGRDMKPAAAVVR